MVIRTKRFFTRLGSYYQKILMWMRSDSDRTFYMHVTSIVINH